MLNKHLISLLIWCLLTCFYLMGVLEMGQLYCEMKVCQSCLTLFNPMDYTVHGFLQARILEWVAFPFSRGSSQPRDWTQVSHIAGGFFTSWATREATLWKTVKFLSPGSSQDPLHCSFPGWSIHLHRSVLTLKLLFFVHWLLNMGILNLLYVFIDNWYLFLESLLFYLLGSWHIHFNCWSHI